MKIDYKKYNLCITCRIKYPKDLNFCTDCGQRLRYRPSGQKNRLRELEVVRY